jgi:peptide deformylase
VLEYVCNEVILVVKKLDILDESDKILREKSEEVVFPLDKKDRELIDDMLQHLRDSQDEELSEKYDLRPGMGLAAVQLGVLKRYFVIAYQKEDGSFLEYVIINPKLVSHSAEVIYAGMGEGCLSVNRETEGIVPRHARITVEGYDVDGNMVKHRVREEIAIAFQHEMDHLNGILFVDHIDPRNPFKNADNMREI